MWKSTGIVQRAVKSLSIADAFGIGVLLIRIEISPSGTLKELCQAGIREPKRGCKK